MSTMQAPTNIIDGAKNPQLISDLTAYRLYFVLASRAANPSNKNNAHQKAYFSHAGLKAEDTDVAAAILERFRTQYADLIDRYNKEVERASITGNFPDQQEFLKKRDALVLSTKTALEQQLSPESAASLAAHIQREKVFMKVSKGDGQ